MTHEVENTIFWGALEKEFDKAEHTQQERDRSNGLVYSFDDERIRPYLKSVHRLRCGSLQDCYPNGILLNFIRCTEQPAEKGACSHLPALLGAEKLFGNRAVGRRR